VTLWQAAGDGPAPPGDQAGRALRACHEALRTLPRAATSGLPGVTELLGEALGLVDATAGLPRGDRLLLRGHLLRATAEVLAAGLPDQALHGDAGPGNVLAGPAWNDWEDCCSGPVAWDSGAWCPRRGSRRRARPRRGRARPPTAVPGRRRLDVFVHARAAQTAAWSAYTAGRGADGPGFPARTAARLAWLREQA
jgi:hypothetical protein